jgi:hypothetical protein
MSEKADEARKLRSAIIRTLNKQGYRVKGGLIQAPDDLTKDDIRTMQQLAIQYRRSVAESGLRRYEERLIQYIANGDEVHPAKITPRLHYVEPDSEEELLFRYAALHWSIPVSSGYGRRLRFLVFDESNGKLIGLFGLGDPVYAMRARDEWIGWSSDMKALNLYHVMDAYVLGAVPPYSDLLCGKLVAMLVLSNEVRAAFRKRYAGRRSLIRKKKHLPYLALVTTTSALGRSSVYNRIRINGFTYWTSLGFTQGSGEFHFSNGVYASLRDFVEQHCKPTAKTAAWGTGFRNKREVIRKCLSEVGLSDRLIYHGIQREIYGAPLGRNALRFLRGEVMRPAFYDWPAQDLAISFKERWLLSRAERKPDFKTFDRETFRLW